MKLLRSVLVSLLLALCWSAPGAAYAQGDLPADALVIPQGQTIRADVATTSQPVVVAGEVLGDVTTWSGNIRISGHVSGDVVSYSGDVVLDAGAQVDGHVLTVGGSVSGQHAAAAIGGELINGAPGGAVFGLIELFRPSAGGAPAAGPLLRGAFSLAAVLILLALATFGALLWPRRTAATVSTLRAAPWRSLSLGGLTTALLALLLVPVGALLAVTLVGLPLLLPLLLALQLPYVYGLAAVGRQFGLRLVPTQPELATTVGTLLVLLPLALISVAAPLVSLALFYLVASAGLGATILSRGGTLALG